jgi:predicted transcriptional regulator
MKVRESFKREALAAWRDFQETGLHITGEELGTWLDSWGTGQERDLPKLHG